MDYVNHLIWDLAMELTFDCFFVTQVFPASNKNHVARRLKSSSALMTTHVRKSLKQEGRHRSFQTALHFLGDVELQIQIAQGLGFLEPSGCHRLRRMAASLQQLMVETT